MSLWLALTVAWFAAHVLGRIAPHAAARLLKDHARNARLLLVARAVKRIGYRAPHRGCIPVDMRPHTCRRVAGAALRRALRSDARAFCAVLAKSERWIARIARRLQRGFTKLRRLPRAHRASHYLLAAEFMPPLQTANTS